MDLEKLTKHQTILLALLLSFVTSIATGIVTVTLMDQAPPAITNTINRVVERTVEVVVPDPRGQAASVITKETTVIVKEENLVTEAIKQGSKYVARIEYYSEEEKSFITSILGAVISSNGMIVTDSEYVVDGGKYFARINGNRYATKVVGQDEDRGIAILNVVFGKDESVVDFHPASFADMADLNLGQTLISLGGINRDVIAMGVISGFVSQEVSSSEKPKEGEKPKTVSVLSRIDTNINNVTMSGGPNLNVFGDMLGMTIASKSGSYIVPASSILAFVQKLESEKKVVSE